MSTSSTATTIVWATGPEGGSWNQIDRGLAAIIAKHDPSLLVSLLVGGGKENPQLVSEGLATLGTTIDFVAAAAARGKDPYDRVYGNLSSIGSGWSLIPFHFVAAIGREQSLRDALAGTDSRFAVPPVGTFDEVTFRRALGFFGTSYAALASQGIEVFHADYREIPPAFTSGAVDYVFGATSAPGAPITALFHRPGGAVLLPLDSDLLEHLRADYGVATGTIAAGTYPGASEPIATAVMETIFIVSAKAPPDLIDRVTSVLLDHQGELRNVHPSLVAFDPSRAISKSMLPLHAGAVRAYERRGFHT